MWRLPRSAQTTIPCRHCKTPLTVERSCRRVTLTCPVCRLTEDVTAYAGQADEALEEFVGNVPCDRT